MICLCQLLQLSKAKWKEKSLNVRVRWISKRIESKFLFLMCRQSQQSHFIQIKAQTFKGLMYSLPCPHFLLLSPCVLVAQSCLTLCNPTDCSPTGSSVHGILQARILEWLAIPFSRGSSQFGDQTLVPCIAGRFFTV